MTNSTRDQIVFFPSVAEMAANPYWPLLSSALEESGATLATPASLTARWLWANRRQVRVLHFHFIQQFYAYQDTDARLDWVVRFARNLVLARTLGYHTVFTLHNLTPTQPLRPSWADYLAHWCAANLTNRVIVHCHAAQRLIAQRYGRRRNVHVIAHPNYVGVYPNTVTKREARAALALDDTHFVFAFVGGIRPNKGVDRLVAAFQGMPEQHLRLVVAGAPWPPIKYAHELARAAERDTRIQVMLDQIPDDRLQVYLNATDVVVTPFGSILSSGSAILAMSFGRPVVAPAMGCLAELVGSDAGVLYDASNPQALATALRTCLHSDIAAMGQCAVERVRELTWASMANETLAVYGQASARSQSSVALVQA